MTERFPSGIEGLDTALGGGLMPGDNVVWFGGDPTLHALVQEAFFAGAPSSAPKVFVSTREAPADVVRRLGDVEVLDARPGKPFTDPVQLERTVVERGRDGAWVAIDNLDDFVRRLRPERASQLFSRICPQLFDVGSICYWSAGAGSRSIRERVRGVSQCVFDITAGRLRIDKAEGRRNVRGRVYRLRVRDGTVHVEQERAIGRLAEGLRELRATRGLSQSDVARVAGVSPSAISQAEAGHRGLGLETVIAIAEGYGVSLDALLEAGSHPGYVIARRDRAVPRRGVTPLLDDPSTGLRTFLVLLGPGEQGQPPTAHKGPELIVVASGLVQIDLGDETPVMRAGDAALATTTAVHGWRNLSSSGSTFFWVLRDPLLPEG